MQSAVFLLPGYSTLRSCLKHDVTTTTNSHVHVASRARYRPQEHSVAVVEKRDCIIRDETTD